MLHDFVQLDAALVIYQSYHVFQRYTTTAAGFYTKKRHSAEHRPKFPLVWIYSPSSAMSFFICGRRNRITAAIIVKMSSGSM